jgi:hypothetical protein
VREAIARHIPERRGPSVRHPLTTLVRQRVYQVACGYEDQNDSDTLRSDPLLKLVLGSLPETGVDLASQPTISRLENAPDARSCLRIARELGELYVRERGKDGAPKTGAARLRRHRRPDPRRSRRILLPRLLQNPHVSPFGGVRRRNEPAANGGLAARQHSRQPRDPLGLEKRVVRRLREAWGQGIEIESRADAGFAVPSVYEYCEKEGIDYTIGLISNPRLEAMAEPLLEEAERESEAQAGTKVRLVGEGSYRALSWDHARRVVYKAEVLEKGTNTRFVVTSKNDEPSKLYDWYVKRGEAEGWMKDFKRALKADRLSCHRFLANQFRLLLHAAAYWLLDALRRRLVARGVRRMQLDTLRLWLIKIGGRVRELLTMVKLHLASGHPGQRLWRLLAEPQTCP